ncbi:hypothetical protein AAMO2058_000092200 [Amorphochlora amoebiformis]
MVAWLLACVCMFAFRRVGAGSEGRIRTFHLVARGEAFRYGGQMSRSHCIPGVLEAGKKALESHRKLLDQLNQESWEVSAYFATYACPPGKEYLTETIKSIYGPYLKGFHLASHPGGCNQDCSRTKHKTADQHSNFVMAIGLVYPNTSTSEIIRSNISKISDGNSGGRERGRKIPGMFRKSPENSGEGRVREDSGRIPGKFEENPGKIQGSAADLTLFTRLDVQFHLPMVLEQIRKEHALARPPEGGRISMTFRTPNGKVSDYLHLVPRAKMRLFACSVCLPDTTCFDTCEGRAGDWAMRCTVDGHFCDKTLKPLNYRLWNSTARFHPAEMNWRRFKAQEANPFYSVPTKHVYLSQQETEDLAIYHDGFHKSRKNNPAHLADPLKNEPEARHKWYSYCNKRYECSQVNAFGGGVFFKSQDLFQDLMQVYWKLYGNSAR